MSKSFKKKNPEPAPMPKPTKVKKPRGKPSTWIFHLVSGRGSDHTKCVILPAGTKEKDAREFADDWAENIIRGSAIESCTVSYKRVIVPARPALLKQWEKVCNRYAAVKKTRDELAVKLNPLDWTHR